MAILYFLRLIGKFCGHLVYIFSRFGILYQEKSGNPGVDKNSRVSAVFPDSVERRGNWQKQELNDSESTQK
jgi:hypothetical protein